MGKKKGKNNEMWKTKPKKVQQQKPTDEVQSIAQIVVESAKESVKELTKKKGIMTVEETKLGVTLVISKGEIEELGMSTKLTTREAIREIKKRLGIGAKE